MDACHSAFAQTHRTYTTTSDSEWKLWILGGDDASVRGGSSTVTNVPLWWGMLIIYEAMPAGGVYGKGLYFPNFAVNLKLLFKIKFNFFLKKEEISEATVI